MTDDMIDETEIETTDTTLTLRRTFDAPRERVWRAFTDPDELERWFVPEGMTAEVHANELEPGGTMSITWTDGENRIENEGYYVEVDEHERLVSGEETDDGELSVTYEFRDVDDGTEVVVTQEFPDAVPDGAAEGWTGMLDALADLLEARSTEIETSEASLTIRRTFDAPPERLFRAFTDPDELAKWYAPGDMTAEIQEWEPEPGGALSISMLDEDGSHDAEGTFTEVVENERLVHTWTWTHVDDPVETRITVEFVPLGEGTEVVMTHEGHPDAKTTEENAGGWSGVFENLAAMLRERE